MSTEIPQIAQPGVTAQAALAAGARAAVGIDADGGEMYEVEELLGQHVGSGLLEALLEAAQPATPAFGAWHCLLVSGSAIGDPHSARVTMLLRPQCELSLGRAKLKAPCARATVARASKRATPGSPSLP